MESLPADIEDRVVAHIHELSLDHLAANTLANSKVLVLDTIGAILSARGHDSVAEVEMLAVEWGGRPDARVLGSSRRILAQHAALANGTMARALELDDVHERAMLHSTATIVPVALAAAELAGGVSGATFLSAVIAGIDLSARMSLATLAPQAESAPRAMSLTYQSGILAGALTAARIMGLSPADMLNVLGVAYSQCAGNQQALYEGVATVRVQQGLSAMTAIMSLELAMAGVSGVRRPLSGEAGYFTAFHRGQCDREALFGGLGQHFAVDDVSIKPYPCCKYTHTAIVAALAARQDPRFDLSLIEKVTAHVNSREYFSIVCEPQENATRRDELTGPNGRVRAQFSLAHMVATALRYGSVELEHLDDGIRTDPATLALMDRVVTVIDPAFASQNARPRMPVPGILDIIIAGDSRPLHTEAEVPPGHPDNRMTFRDVADKYARVRALFAPSPFGTSAIELLERLEEVPDVRAVIDGVAIDTAAATGPKLASVAQASPAVGA